jgi:hypothetical protein
MQIIGADKIVFGAPSLYNLLRLKYYKVRDAATLIMHIKKTTFDNVLQFDVSGYAVGTVNYLAKDWYPNRADMLNDFTNINQLDPIMPENTIATLIQEADMTTSSSPLEYQSQTDDELFIVKFESKDGSTVGVKLTEVKSDGSENEIMSRTTTTYMLFVVLANNRTFRVYATQGNPYVKIYVAKSSDIVTDTVTITAEEDDANGNALDSAQKDVTAIVLDITPSQSYLEMLENVVIYSG